MEFSQELVSEFYTGNPPITRLFNNIWKVASLRNTIELRTVALSIWFRIFVFCCFFSKMQQKLQLVVWLCSCIFFLTNFLCSENHKLRMIYFWTCVFKFIRIFLSKNYKDKITPPLAFFWHFWKKTKQQNQDPFNQNLLLFVIQFLKPLQIVFLKIAAHS